MLTFYERLHTCKPVENYMLNFNNLVKNNDIGALKELLLSTTDFSFINHYNPLSYYKDKNLDSPFEIIYNNYSESFETFKLLLENNVNFGLFITLNINNITSIFMKGDSRYLNYIIDSHSYYLTNLWQNSNSRDNREFYPLNNFLNLDLPKNIVNKLIPLWNETILLDYLSKTINYNPQEKNNLNNILKYLNKDLNYFVKKHPDIMFYTFSHNNTHSTFLKDFLNQCEDDFWNFKNSKGYSFLHYFCQYEFDDLHYYKYSNSKSNELFNVYEKIIALFKRFPNKIFELLTSKDNNSNTPIALLISDNFRFFTEIKNRMGLDISHIPSLNNIIINNKNETISHLILTKDISTKDLVICLNKFNCDINKPENIDGKTPLSLYCYIKQISENDSQILPLKIYQEKRTLNSIVTHSENSSKNNRKRL